MRAYLQLKLKLSLISAVVDEQASFSSLSPVPFQVVVAVPLCFLRGHLFTLAGTLWTLVLHVRSSIRLACVDRPAQGIGDGPVYRAKISIIHEQANQPNL